MDYYVVTFESITDAMYADKLVSSLGGIIIPVPSEISADCGFAVKIPEPVLPLNIINETDYFKIYKISGKGKNKIIEQYYP